MSVRRVLAVSGLALGFLLAFSLLAIPAAQAAVSITVDKNSQQMTVAVDGVTRYTWPVSSGLPAYETPNGTFKAFRMEADHYSKEWDDAPMPHSIFFTKQGHAIHGTDHVRGIGNPASHGCVRLSRENAATLFALVEQEGVLNTTVTLTGSSTVALARRKSAPVSVARAEPQVITGDATFSGDAAVSDDTTVRAPQQLVPPGRRTYQGQIYQGQTYQGQAYQGDNGNVVYGIDQWGRTVALRRPQRRVYDAQSQSYETQAYDARPYYAPQQSYGYRNPYYTPRRGLFGDW